MARVRAKARARRRAKKAKIKPFFIFACFVGWLAFVGLGLCPDCVSLRALSFLKSADYVFLDTYTSYMPGFGWKELAALIGKDVVPLRRQDLEEKGGRRVLESALRGNVAFASVGDPFVATTHVYLRNAALQRKIPVIYVPGVSIHSAAFSLAGLQVYKSGPPATIVEPTDIYRPKSAFEKVVENLRRGLHTLLLLDIDLANMRFMSFSRGAQLLIEGLSEYGVDVGKLLGVGLSVVGSDRQGAVASTLEGLTGIRNNDFPQSLIVPGRLDPVETEALMFLGANQEQLANHARLVEGIGR